MSEKNNYTISQKLAKFEELIAWFESEGFELEDAIVQFKEAQKLADEIERDLADLKNEIIVLKKKFDED